MKILIIDGQGGGLGRQLVTAVKEQYPEIEVLAVGTNSAATNAMLRAGADCRPKPGKADSGTGQSV